MSYNASSPLQIASLRFTRSTLNLKKIAISDLMLKKTHKTRANKDTLLMQEREEVFSGDNHEMSAFHEGEKAQNAMQNEVSALMSQLEELDNHLKLVSPSNSVDIDSMNQNDLKDQMASIKKWMEGVRRKMAEINGFLKQWQRESSGYFRAEEKNEKFDEINFFDDPDQFDANAETAPTLLQDPNGWKSFGKSSPNPEMSELTAVKEKNTKLMPEDHDSDIELTDGEKPLAVVDDLVEEKPSSNEQQDEEVYYEVEDEFLVRDNNISGENINEEGQRQEGENDDFFYQLDQWQEGKEDDYQLSRRGWYGGIVVPDYYDALTDEEKLKCMENLLKNEASKSMLSNNSTVKKSS
ncbi:hypothetical protein Q1695_000609 [Nippostrongylus brasiliensis]|nr:hypothetical protein Q1695_000609 [Nippostrongylus brasiliensis]